MVTPLEQDNRVLYTYRKSVVIQILGCLPQDAVITDMEWIERHVHMKMDRIALYGYLWHMKLNGLVRVHGDEEHEVAVTLLPEGKRKLDEYLDRSERRQRSFFKVQVRTPR